MPAQWRDPYHFFLLLGSDPRNANTSLALGESIVFVSRIFVAPALQRHSSPTFQPHAGTIQNTNRPLGTLTAHFNKAHQRFS